MASTDKLAWQPVLPVIVSGFDLLPGQAGGWAARVTDPACARIFLPGLAIDAGMQKYLYLRASAGGQRPLQVAFSGDGKYTLIRSFRGSLPAADGSVWLCFDLHEVPLWKGLVTGLWIDLEKSVPGEVFQLFGMGCAAQPAAPEEIGTVETVTPQVETWAMTDRMAAYHQTLVDVDETVPNVEILTYNLDELISIGQYLLARLVAYVDVGGRRLGPDDSLDLHVEDFPGGVAVEYRLAGTRVSLEVVPLLLGRESVDPAQQCGAALYRLQTAPPAPLTVQMGGGMKVIQWGPDLHTHIRDAQFGGGADTVEISGETAVLRFERQPIPVVVRCAGQMSAQTGSDGGRFLQADFPAGQAEMVITFARDPDRAAALSEGLDIQAARQAVDAYYAGLLSARVETPEVEIDGAFRSAIYNLEYNWYPPYGWVECMHHWVSMWHMQHTMGAEWLGQADRSKSTTLSQAERLYPNGAVPMLAMNGERFLAWGGTNQFFAWQVRHYWNFTAERDFIAAMAPALARAIDQTYAEYDPDGDLLLAWREQIGNQEDYAHHPHNGGATTIEGINMLRTQALLARALGDEPAARQSDARADAAAANLRRKLWQPDLGRFAYFEDPHGVRRPDGLYQEYIYPAVQGFLDPLDSWTSIRHLRDRMTGLGGEIYCSNTFPNHVGGTWGMQAGMSQQPWGAWGLAAVGLRNETFQPLRAAGRWVMSARLRGGWPEISTERYVSYYSPPPAVFIQAVVEALFGLEMCAPEGALKVAPSFPDDWPQARLSLPDFQAIYRREGNILHYEIESRAELARQVRWLLPPGRVSAALVDGVAVDFRTTPMVGCQLLTFDTPPCRKCALQLTVEPLAYQVEGPASIAEGEELLLTLRGCRVLAVDDRCGVLSQIRMETDTCLRAAVRAGLLDPYLPYGRLGLLNFSRRTFFLYCQGGDGSLFWHPVDLAVLPRFEVCQRGELEPAAAGAQTSLVLRNNTFNAVRGAAFLTAAGVSLPFSADLPPRSEILVALTLPRPVLAGLSPGDNSARVSLPGGVKLDVTLAVSERLAAQVGRPAAALALPDSALAADVNWKDFRTFYAYAHLPWARSGPPLAALDQPALALPGLPVDFQLNGRRLVPVSWKSGRPAFRLDLHGRRIKKLYLLVVPFLDSHDTFTPVARITLQRADDRLVGRTLYSPGDLDWWCPSKAVDIFCTARLPRPDRGGLLPLLPPGAGDWPQGKPTISYFTLENCWVNEHDEPWETSFPQPEYWAACRALNTPSTVLNVVEMDLGEPAELKSLTLSTIGTEPAVGLVAVSAEFAESSGQST